MLDEIKVYVGTYRKYGEGSLAGGWLTLGDFDSLEDFIEAAVALHGDEDDPELMYQDFENQIGNLMQESWLSANLWTFTDEDIDAVIAFDSLMSYEYDADTFNNAYYGAYYDEEAFAEEFVGNCYEPKEPLNRYFDYAKFARDLFSGDFVYVDGYVFSMNF